MPWIENCYFLTTVIFHAGLSFQYVDVVMQNLMKQPLPKINIDSFDTYILSIIYQAGPSTLATN